MSDFNWINDSASPEVQEDLEANDQIVAADPNAFKASLHDQGNDARKTLELVQKLFLSGVPLEQIPLEDPDALEQMVAQTPPDPDGDLDQLSDGMEQFRNDAAERGVKPETPSGLGPTDPDYEDAGGMHLASKMQTKELSMLKPTPKCVWEGKDSIPGPPAKKKKHKKIRKAGVTSYTAEPLAGEPSNLPEELPEEPADDYAPEETEEPETIQDLVDRLESVVGAMSEDEVDTSLAAAATIIARRLLSKLGDITMQSAGVPEEEPEPTLDEELSASDVPSEVMASNSARLVRVADRLDSLEIPIIPDLVDACLIRISQHARPKKKRDLLRELLAPQRHGLENEMIAKMEREIERREQKDRPITAGLLDDPLNRVQERYKTRNLMHGRGEPGHGPDENTLSRAEVEGFVQRGEDPNDFVEIAPDQFRRRDDEADDTAVAEQINDPFKGLFESLGASNSHDLRLARHMKTAQNQTIDGITVGGRYQSSQHSFVTVIEVGRHKVVYRYDDGIKHSCTPDAFKMWYKPVPDGTTLHSRQFRAAQSLPLAVTPPETGITYPALDDISTKLVDILLGSGGLQSLGVAKKLNISQSTAKRILSRLQQAGIVVQDSMAQYRKDGSGGRQVFWRLTDHYKSNSQPIEQSNDQALDFSTFTTEPTGTQGVEQSSDQVVEQSSSQLVEPMGDQITGPAFEQAAANFSEMLRLAQVGLPARTPFGGGPAMGRKLRRQPDGATSSETCDNCGEVMPLSALTGDPNDPTPATCPYCGNEIHDEGDGGGGGGGVEEAGPLANPEAGRSPQSLN